MQFLKNPKSISTCFVLAMVLILPTCSSSHQGKVIRSIDIVDASNNNNFTLHQKLMDPKILYQIKVHGFLLWASMGLLMPIGILSIRMSNCKEEQCGRNLKVFYLHATSQMMAVILATIAAIMSIRNFNNSFNNYHQRIGAGLYAAIWLQALLGFLRPPRECKNRGKWFLGHWLLGTSVAVMGTINIYIGLHAYHQKTSSTSTKLWNILFTIQVSCFAFFYLFQEKWGFILRQGTLLTDDFTNLAHNNTGVAVIDGQLNETTVVPQKC